MIIYFIFWEMVPGADGRLQSLSQTLSPNPHIGGWEGSLRGRAGELTSPGPSLKITYAYLSHPNLRLQGEPV